MEIERKFLFDRLPDEQPVRVIRIIQGYISTDPVIRFRHKTVYGPEGPAGAAPEKEEWVLTVKGSGLMAREEYELALTEGQFKNLEKRRIGHLIEKTRYCYALPGGLTVEADVFEGAQAGLLMADVEFPDVAAAQDFVPPAWFRQDVTEDIRYHNSNMIGQETENDLK